MKTAIFLGAGASKAEGAPLQSELFKEYFLFNRSKGSMFYNSDMERELCTFFEQIFTMNVDESNLDHIDFPTFEEVLGVVDQAIIRNESLKDYDLDNINVDSNRLRQIRTYLILLMVHIIDEKLKGQQDYHVKLINNLILNNILRDTIFISTNYDILIDNALTYIRDNGIDLDYSIDFANYERDDGWKHPRNEKAVHLFKLHGSLNWLYCPTCNNITITPLEKGISRLIMNIGKAGCPDCETLYSPILIPPTFFKNMSNVFIQQIWNKAEQHLRKVDHLIFCGYSFPDADVHVKYLIKRIQTNRNSSLNITVINHYEGKSVKEVDDEKSRYNRFLGHSVNYTEASFQDFSQDPIQFMK